MDSLYKIIGKKLVGDGIKLILIPMQPSKEFSTTKIMSNLSGFMNDMKADATRSRNPDSITITQNEYMKGKYELGSAISISITIGD